MSAAPPPVTTLLERDDVLNALSEALTASRSEGRLVAISGEAGVGKTALLQALAERERRSTPFVWGACEALSTPRPLGPLLDMAEYLGPEFESVLSSTQPRHQVFAAFVGAIAQRTPPTVIVFEDLHWADEATLDLVRYVSRRLHRIGALIVVTWRADEVGAEHPLRRALGEMPPQATLRIELPPLSLDAVTQLAGRTRDGHAVYALTGGNPFFVTELLRCGCAAVPASVRDAILARRAALPQESRQLLDLVSVVPARAEIDLVRATVHSATEALTPAAEAGLLTFDGRAVGFRHELARLAVLESLPLLRVQELHRVVLDALSAFADRDGVLARLVHHAVGAADGCAVHHFAPMAARQAAALGAHREAAAHYRTALGWADRLEPSARAEILDLLSYERYLTGDMAAARDARVEALVLWRQLHLPRAIGRTVRWLSRLAWFLGNHEEATARAAEALEVLTPLGEDEELAMALSNSAQLHMLAREPGPCIEIGRRAITMARRLGSIDVLSHALNNVGSSLASAGDPAGRQLQEESLALALDHDLHEHAARAFTNLSTCSIHARDYAYSRRWIDRGINYSLDRDLDAWWLYMLAYRARLLVETGHWTDAELDATGVIANGRVSVVAKIPALATLGLLRARRRRDDAAALLDEALALALPTAEKQRLVPVRAARAEFALLQGRPDDARTEADAGLALLSATDLHWDWELLRYLKWRADGSAALSAAERESLSAAARGPHADHMLGHWRIAADGWARVGCPYEQAEALADGDVPAMEHALQIVLSLGAAPAIDRVRQRLRSAGVSRLRRGPRPSTRAHPAGLTRRETEILMLLSHRLSNPAIGDRLFVSPKTVEHHVSSIIGKLDVSTRDEAVAEARRRGWLIDHEDARAI